MAEERVQRRLAAILVADVVGYTRLMEHDEAGTVAALKARRKEVLEPLVAKHQGRIFKVTGDGVLVEFASAVNAVQCAVDLQQAMAAVNRDQPENRHVVLRIGVNLGDVIVESGDLYGEGVNIAARLETLAEPGGILISGTAHDHIKGKVNVGFDDLGVQSLKNIAESIRTYRVASTPRESPAVNKVTADKPSIALLPFVNMSGDPAQDYFVDGITENIITGLSRFRDLFVIASNSTFAYKGKAARVQDASRELGVHYVIEGSVQKASDRVRITAQLIDGETGRHLWAERYDRNIADIFAVQDEVTEMIVGTLATGYGGRLHKAWQGRTASFRAYDHFRRGMDLFNRFTREDVERAKECFHEAVNLDPAYGKAYAKIAWTHMCDVCLGWSENPADSMATALEFATLAVARDDDEAWGHWALAGYHLFTQQHDRAIAAYRKAMELNPNDADVLNDFGQCLSFAGRAKEGVEMVRKAMRLNPHYPEYWVAQFGPILFDARQYDDAVTTLESLRLLDTIIIHLYLAASHAALGHASQARKAMARVIEVYPQATLQNCTSAEMTPYKDQKDLEHFRENLRKAGLPE